MTMSFDNPSGTVMLGYDLDVYSGYGIKQEIHWNPDSQPMLLVVGGTGSGKSYFLSQLMARISIYLPDSRLYLCDFKNIDFREYAECPRRWSYDACTEGLSEFYESFQARLNGEDGSTNRKFFIFDEWAAFVMSREKKAAEEVKSKLSTLLMMGRGVRHHVIIGLQRADAQLFPLGGRDQFGAIIALGNLSREQRLMLFQDNREEMTATNARGQGYLSLDGEPLRRIQIPTVRDFPKLQSALRDGLTR